MSGSLLLPNDTEKADCQPRPHFVWSTPQRRTATTAEEYTLLRYEYATEELRDLSSPPGNRLETLKGNWQGFHSIRVNDQWRVIFRWSKSGPEGVDVVDYH